jgi:Mg2+ and Co2+ transporter CorA
MAQRSFKLADDCEQGMATLANSSILQESRRMTDNAERVRKLTILATTFIPSTFTSSLYGMNFRELGTGDLRVGV